MKFTESKLKDLCIADLSPLIDERGYFVRSYCNEALKKIGISKSIKQINHSFTSKLGTIRGMHFQRFPHAEVKMVRCIVGKIFDVAIDLRRAQILFWNGTGNTCKQGTLK